MRTRYSFGVAHAITWDAPAAEHPARGASRASMTAVAEGRKDDWLALLAQDAVIEDPVGPSMLDPEGKGHHGHEGISRFWDQNFGAVSRFHFHVTDSFANGPCCANVVAITMGLGDDGATMTVEGVMVYTVNEAGLITSIRGHWEPDRALATITRPPQS
jgi:steroid Delta-isomerase